jgi:hypothetical protein
MRSGFRALRPIYRQARAVVAAKAFLVGREPAAVIYVPGRLVNLVVK